MVGETLTALLNEHYSSQSEAAHALGVPRGTLARAMKGDQLPGAPLLQALAVHGFNVSDLLLARQTAASPRPSRYPNPPDLFSHLDTDPASTGAASSAAAGTTLPLFSGLLPAGPAEAADRASGAIAVHERWVRSGSYAVWTRGEFPPDVLLPGGPIALSSVPQLNADYLVVWTRDVPRWISTGSARGTSRSGPRKTFLAKTVGGWKYLMPSVLLDEGNAPLLSLAHDVYAGGDGEPGDAADAVARPRDPHADGPSGQILRVAGFVAHLFGNYHPL
ncbi:helix-turn-helix domain-containing protein [Alienimonas sp. DA493]|uniref:helix-turn-helix domain-containing protein n=1 Tax=Alienimonas sp. DA493 TaxID=3373605 RepID=UPI00375460AD